MLGWGSYRYTWARVRSSQANSCRASVSVSASASTSRTASSPSSRPCTAVPHNRSSPPIRSRTWPSSSRPDLASDSARWRSPLVNDSSARQSRSSIRWSIGVTSVGLGTWRTRLPALSLIHISASRAALDWAALDWAAFDRGALAWLALAWAALDWTALDWAATEGTPLDSATAASARIFVNAATSLHDSLPRRRNRRCAAEANRLASSRSPCNSAAAARITSASARSWPTLCLRSSGSASSSCSAASSGSPAVSRALAWSICSLGTRPGASSRNARSVSS